ncbi:uncharacterized protein BO95DRAFT_288987 [Aspergillus brunneoviolaceus CBS 621.78]|uniref:Uncharacterized protein n=1 Tax=Aspergillus brunneoviolaceus CBS 621.78 TaxID=1450534 RepID=A0ACD1FV15_9EURO|nr:hypothetical protein BO95DRAFT_288987 [Aspergillus brunneoviolaceus CBS 621.78]RAH40799.1 hypothetical protein BO95DRAFT_288987 [Aspergillus brunneoviolaceus CBS 621.78]
MILDSLLICEHIPIITRRSSRSSIRQRRNIIIIIIIIIIILIFSPLTLLRGHDLCSPDWVTV